MTIRLLVVPVTDGDAKIHGTPPRKLFQVVGLLPSDQVLLQGPIVEGHAHEVQRAAVEQVADWLRAHRPTWDSAWVLAL